MTERNHPHDPESSEITLIAIGSSSGGIAAWREILSGFLPGALSFL